MADWFYPLRNLTILFASIMLVKYFIFLITAPFYSTKEAWRSYRISKLQSQPGYTAYRPRVSVIVPAWNEEVGLLKTIRSIIQNTYPYLEVIVVNDGSTDRSHDIMREFLARFTWRRGKENVKIRYYYKENGGKGTALNHGIQAATGEIILTVDADSALDKQAIQNLVHYFEDPNLDAVVGNVKVISQNSFLGQLQALEYLFGFYFKRAHSFLNAEYIFGGACAAFRKSTTFDRLGLFDIGNKTEDIEMSLRTRYNGLHSAYAEDVICYTEGASTVRGLINQRLRWKKGRFDTFARYRRLFFSLDKRHNRFLSWFVLPYSLFSEIQLLFEPIGVTLLVTYSVLSADYLSLALGVMFIFITYLVTSLFSGQGLRWGVLIRFIFTWPLFYFLVWIEYLALCKSLIMILRGDDITWQRWERQGIGEVV